MMNSIPGELLRLLVDGGVLMTPLIATGVVGFAMAFRLWRELRRVAANGHPAAAELRAQSAAPARECVTVLTGRRVAWQMHLERQLHFIRIMAGTAPLLGLLGTVAGMLKTFRGLSARHGADTMDLVARGISEALVTTEVGLAFGVIGLVWLFALKEYRDRLQEVFLTFEARLLLNHHEEAPC
jgi:biopolymer transport protein ExbB